MLKITVIMEDAEMKTRIRMSMEEYIDFVQEQARNLGIAKQEEQPFRLKIENPSFVDYDKGSDDGDYADVSLYKVKGRNEKC